MASRRWTIAVAGCGPAGMAAALLLARDGHEVTVFERFEAPRAVGSGLMIQPTGLAVLRALGLDRALIDVSARIERLFGRVMPSGRTVLDVRYGAVGAGRFGLGVHRAALFDLLHGAVAAAGIPVRTGHSVRAVAAGVLSFADAPEAGPFDVVVDALGTSTPLAPACGRVLDYGALWATLDLPAGFDPAVLAQRYIRASRMVGVLPLGGGKAAMFWSLRADALPAWQAAGLAAWKAEVAALWPETAPLLDQVVRAEQMTFARYSHRTLASPAGRGLIHVGDAWHSASPQLGQGANMALLDAFALAAALRGADSVEAGLDRAVRLRRKHVWLYQAMSAAFTPAYQGDGRVMPWVRDWVIGPAATYWPVSRITAAMVSGTVGWPMRGLPADQAPP